MSREVAFIIVH